MSRTLRVILIVFSSIVAVAIVVFCALVWMIRRPFPDVRGTVRVPGLSADVEIFRDEDGVPHIYAGSVEDAFFGEGYAHAQDRFWQMEFWRRIGAGQLSEILGESTLDQDRYLRTMGFARVAQLEYDRLPPDQRGLLDAYARGVNAYILGRRPSTLGLEFLLLKLTGAEIEIRPWTGVNSLTWAKIMALDLSTNMGTELSNISLLRFGGRNLFELIRSPYREDMPFIVSLEEVARFREEQGLPGLPVTARTVAGWYSASRSGIGSNNWVIGGDRTASGLPILANDMHLGVQMPSIWYEVGIHVQTTDSGAPLNLRGFSFPGVPSIIAGQNDSIAWGMTNLGGDVQDLFLEQVNPDNPDEYWDGSEWKPMDIRLESIAVDGRDEPEIQRVRSTPRGPILSDLPQLTKWFSFANGGSQFPDDMEMTEISLSWTALQPETLFSAILDLSRAKDAYQAREALRKWGTPSQNLVFADDQGNIGYQSTGSFPDRHPSEGRAPRSGWLQTDPGLLSFDDLPAVINPERGYIVTANNPVISPAYPYPLGLDYSNGLRARRITDLITGAPDAITTDYVALIQGDVFSRTADEVLPVLLDSTAEEALAARRSHREQRGVTEDEDSNDGDDRDFVAEGIRILAEWDRNMTPDSAGAAAFSFVWAALIEAAFSDEVPAYAWPITGVSTFESVLYGILDDPGHVFWDDRLTADAETLDDISAIALADGLFAAREVLGSNPESWKWGTVHTIEFRNATLGESGIGVIERLFNRGPFPVAGGASTVNVSHWNLDDLFAATTIVSERAIYDLADPSNSRFIHPTGQSGHPFQRNYLSFFKDWSNTRYHPARWTREEVEESSRGRRLLLRPEESKR